MKMIGRQEHVEKFVAINHSALAQCILLVLVLMSGSRSRLDWHDWRIADGGKLPSD